MHLKFDFRNKTVEKNTNHFDFLVKYKTKSGSWFVPP